MSIFLNRFHNKFDAFPAEWRIVNAAFLGVCKTDVLISRIPITSTSCEFKWSLNSSPTHNQHQPNTVEDTIETDLKMSIFGAAGGTTLGSTAGNRHSLEFKAGRMNLIDSDQDGVKKKMIHPDNRSAMTCRYFFDFATTKHVPFQKRTRLHLLWRRWVSLWSHFNRTLTH